MLGKRSREDPLLDMDDPKRHCTEAYLDQWLQELEEVSSFEDLLGENSFLLSDYMLEETQIQDSPIFCSSLVQTVEKDDGNTDCFSVIKCHSRKGGKKKFSDKSHVLFSKQRKVGKRRRWTIFLNKTCPDVKNIKVRLCSYDKSCFYLMKDESGNCDYGTISLPCDGLTEKSFYLVPTSKEEDPRSDGIKGKISHRLEIVYYLKNGEEIIVNVQDIIWAGHKYESGKKQTKMHDFGPTSVIVLKQQLANKLLDN